MVKGMTCQILMIEKVAVAPTRYRAVVLTSWDHVMSDSERDPPATEAVKKSLDQSITQVTEIRRLGRGQSIGSSCDKFQRAPASSFRGFVLESTVQLQLTAEAPVTRIGRGISKLRRGRVEFIAP